MKNILHFRCTVLFSLYHSHIKFTCTQWSKTIYLLAVTGRLALNYVKFISQRTTTTIWFYIYTYAHTYACMDTCVYMCTFTSKREVPHTSLSAAIFLTRDVLYLLEFWKLILTFKLLNYGLQSLLYVQNCWLTVFSETACDIQTNKQIQKWESVFIMFSFAPIWVFSVLFFQNVKLLGKTKKQQNKQNP